MIECHYSSYKDGNKSTRLLRNVCARIRGMSEQENTMLAKNSPVLKILNEKVDILNLNPTEKKLYESRMMLKSDIVSISNSQFRKGREEGFLTTAKRMKKANFDVSVIQEITGLSKEEIENIKM